MAGCVKVILWLRSGVKVKVNSNIPGSVVTHDASFPPLSLIHVLILCYFLRYGESGERRDGASG